MRWAALKNGTYPRRRRVMEPFISLGLKEGAHIIAASFYRGGEVISPNLTPEQRKAYYDAENKAVDLHQRRLLQIRPSRRGARQRGACSRTSCCARSCATSTSTITIRRCSTAPTTG